MFNRKEIDRLEVKIKELNSENQVYFWNKVSLLRKIEELKERINELEKENYCKKDNAFTKSLFEEYVNKKPVILDVESAYPFEVFERMDINFIGTRNSGKTYHELLKLKTVLEFKNKQIKDLKESLSDQKELVKEERTLRDEYAKQYIEINEQLEKEKQRSEEILSVSDNLLCKNHREIKRLTEENRLLNYKKENGICGFGERL